MAVALVDEFPREMIAGVSERRASGPFGYLVSPLGGDFSLGSFPSQSLPVVKYRSMFE